MPTFVVPLLRSDILDFGDFALTKVISGQQAPLLSSIHTICRVVHPQTSMKFILAPTTLLFASTAVAQEQYAERGMPVTRFTQWDSLTTANMNAAIALEYDETLWGFLGSNEIELVSWSENALDSTDFETQATILDIDEDQYVVPFLQSLTKLTL